MTALIFMGAVMPEELVDVEGEVPIMTVPYAMLLSKSACRPAGFFALIAPPRALLAVGLLYWLYAPKRPAAAVPRPATWLSMDGGDWYIEEPSAVVGVPRMMSDMKLSCLYGAFSWFRKS